MTDFDPKTVAAFFPVFFGVLWFVVTTMLGLMSGWFSLMGDYGDSDEQAILKTGWQSGSMGLGVGMSNILRIEVCSSGLRFGIMRIFGPFCRDFFVPWGDLQIRRGAILFWPRATLSFGGRSFPRLSISGRLADRLARAAQGRWPEGQAPPPETRRKIVTDIVVQWLAMTAFAAAFFTIAPRMMGGSAAGLPLPVAIGFPAAVFGVVALGRAFVRLTD